MRRRVSFINLLGIMKEHTCRLVFCFLTLIAAQKAYGLSRPDESRIVKAHQDIRALSAAVELYKKDHGVYPTQAEGLSVLTEPSSKRDCRCEPAGYIGRLPLDP